MTLPRTLAPLAAGLLVLCGGVALAAGLTGADAAKDRAQHMKGLGAAAKALGEQFRSGTPDPAVVRLQAERIDTAAKTLPTWFPAGSGAQAWPKSAALPVVWTDAAGFAAAARNFQLAAARLDAAAATGDMTATGAAAKPALGACKACHDKFRRPEKS
ncbi:MAG: cytochrome c [Caulobacteraceae bacterium]